jgi:hypothetical protein
LFRVRRLSLRAHHLKVVVTVVDITRTIVAVKKESSFPTRQRWLRIISSTHKREQEEGD